MSPPYGELRPTNGWVRFVSLGHPSKFQRVSRLAFVTAANSLTGGHLANQTLHNECLAVSYELLHDIYIFGGFCPPDRILPGAKFTLRPSLAFSYSIAPILAALGLLHFTPAAGVSQTLRRGTRNGITELSQRAPPIFGRAAITFGNGPHSIFLYTLKYADLN